MRGGPPTRLCPAIATHGQHVVTCRVDVVPWSARPWRLRKRVDAVYPQVPPAQFVALLALSNRLPPKWRLVESNNPRFVPSLRSVGLRLTLTTNDNSMLALVEVDEFLKRVRDLKRKTERSDA